MMYDDYRYTYTYIKRGFDLFHYLVEVLGYETVAEHFFDWLDSDTIIRALTDLANDYDIDIEED